MIGDNVNTAVEPTIFDKPVKIFVTDRNYNEWSFFDAETNQLVNHPELKTIQPLEHKLFSRDIFTLSMTNNVPTTHVTYSYIKSCTNIAGVLMLENNKTFGRTANKKRLLYKCIPDDVHLPIFLIPYDVKVGFSKVQKNKYVVFRFDNWTDKHPYGLLTETLGDVDNLEVFYEYQLYCKSLHSSLTEFTNKTRLSLNDKTNAEYVSHILQNPTFGIEDCRDKYVFTIDPPNSLDFDDGFCVEECKGPNGGPDFIKVTVYIANVFLWLETLGLWNSFSRRVATIYLPDKRRPMLPTILSDILCSLQQDQPRFALAMEFCIDLDGKLLTNSLVYKNVLISVKKNYTYEEPALVEKDKKYKQLLDISQNMDRNVKNSHDLVAHWMVCMNTHTGLHMAKEKVGIFRSALFVNSNLRTDAANMTNLKEDTVRVIRTWNNTIGQYVLFDKDAVLDHEMMSIQSFKKDVNVNKCVEHKIVKSYIHITSPIRRLVDLLNQIILFKQNNLVKSMSQDAILFLKYWTEQMDYINTATRSIRKIQTDCDVLNRCYCNPEIMEEEHDGIVFDKIMKNDGGINYMVYLEKLKMLSRITTHIDVPNYSHNRFKMFLFEDEDKVKKKIRLQMLDVKENVDITKLA
jgi:exoribonuclease R